MHEIILRANHCPVRMARLPVQSVSAWPWGRRHKHLAIFAAPYCCQLLVWKKDLYNAVRLSQLLESGATPFSAQFRNAPAQTLGSSQSLHSAERAVSVIVCLGTPNGMYCRIFLLLLALHKIHYKMCCCMWMSLCWLIVIASHCVQTLKRRTF